MIPAFAAPLMLPERCRAFAFLFDAMPLLMLFTPAAPVFAAYRLMPLRHYYADY